MQLTRYTDYSLRLLMLLGLRGERLLTIQRVSDAYGVSRNHLVKIVNHLSTLGLVETNRGRKGGIRLAEPPERIVIGRLIRNLEPTLRLAECFDPESNQCVISDVCLLKPALREAEDAFFEALDRYTLADLIRKRRELGASLGLGGQTASMPPPAAVPVEVPAAVAAAGAG